MNSGAEIYGAEMSEQSWRRGKKSENEENIKIAIQTQNK